MNPNPPYLVVTSIVVRGKRSGRNSLYVGTLETTCFAFVPGQLSKPNFVKMDPRNIEDNILHKLLEKSQNFQIILCC